LAYPEVGHLDLGETLDEALASTRAQDTPELSDTGYAAVRLFLESARRVRPDLRLSAEDQAAISRICRFLEGLPLGIELAAAWSRVFSPTEIERETQQNLDFLSTTWSDVPDRHRNMRALFEQSWNYLSESERQTVARLSVFRGGFSYQAAQVVANTTPFSLADLVDRSVIRVQATGRCDTHELVRQFAMQKLDDNHDAARTTRRAHAQHYAAFLEACEQDLRGARQQQSVSAITADLENVRTAWRWSVSHRQVEQIGQSLESLHLFYYARGWAQEGYRALSQALDALEYSGTRDAAPLDRARDRAHTVVVGRLLARKGRFAYRLGLHQEARELLSASLTIWSTLEESQSQVSEDAQTGRDLDVRQETAFSLFCLSAVARSEGKHGEAEQLCEQSHDLYRQCQDQLGVAMALRHLGIISGSTGAFLKAQSQLQEALTLYQKIGNPYGIARTLNDLGIVAAELDQYDAAKRYHQECLVLRRQINDPWGIGTSLNNLGYLAYLATEYASAREYLQESLAIQREIGDRFQIANCLSNLGAAEMALGEAEEAARHLHEGLGMASESGAGPLAMEILGEIGALIGSVGAAGKRDAARLLAFVANHALAGRWVREQAKSMAATVTGALPEEGLRTAKEKGAAGELESIVSDVLERRDAWLSPSDDRATIVPSLE
jgi:tetratricopeptide (TPR) repeat protein